MANTLAKVRLAVVALLLTIGSGFMIVIALLLTVITHPFSAFKKTRRDVPPACLLDSTLGTHGYVKANGIKFHYVAAGDTSKPLMLFLHGFPEFWFCWRNQLREFSKDYRVVAIDLRGYGETERPPRVADYTMDKLVKDVVELVPALGYDKCILVAHDWGGAIGWNVANTHPEVVEKFIVVNCPHFKVLRKAFLTNWKQQFKSWYMFLFQWPKLPELMMSTQDYKMFDDMFANHPGGPKNKAAFPPDVIAAYKYTFSQPGAITAALNYYRCMFKQTQKKTKEGPSQQKIELPVLLIWGDDDVAFDKNLVEENSTVASNLTIKHISNCSHWAQQDAPDTVNQYMREFLQD